jgi:hypothetical protein
MPGSIVNREWHCPWKVLKLRKPYMHMIPPLNLITTILFIKDKFYLFSVFESNLPFLFVVFLENLIEPLV